MKLNLLAHTFIPFLKEQEENISKENIEKLKSYFPNLSEDNFNLYNSLIFSSKMAGICYMGDSFEKIINEPIETTFRRLDQVIASGHHSVFDHFHFTFEIEEMPKIIAMIINNEKDYVTSEKSARYTKFNNLSKEETTLYEKWCDLLKPVIRENYPELYLEGEKNPWIKINKLAQENARYFISIFTPVTTLGYTISLRQLNYLVYMINNFINEFDLSTADEYDVLLNHALKEFVALFDDYIVSGLIPKGKNRKLSLFGAPEYKNLPDVFSYSYQTSFDCTYSCLAQNQRHRSESCFMYRKDKFEFYVPEIIRDTKLEKEWLIDAENIKELYPQGTLIKTVQCGTIDTFILKLRERACGCAQLEIMRHELEIMDKFIFESPYDHIIEEATNGKNAKCQFKDGFCGGKCMLGAHQFNRMI